MTDQEWEEYKEHRRWVPKDFLATKERLGFLVYYVDCDDYRARTDRAMTIGHVFDSHGWSLPLDMWEKDGLDGGTMVDDLFAMTDWEWQVFDGMLTRNPIN